MLEEFLGPPLLSSKIEGAYDVVAQLLGEMCDAGSVCNTEPNALRDVVDIPGWMGKLLGGIGLPGYDNSFYGTVERVLMALSFIKFISSAATFR